MPLQNSKTLPKSSRDKFKHSVSSNRTKTVSNMPKKLLISKTWHPNCNHEVKTKSAGIIDSKQRQKPKNISNSLPAVPKYSDNIKDFCKRCGDTDEVETAVAVFTTNEGSSRSKTCVTSSKNSKKEINADCGEVKVETKVVKQYYKNEKFADSKASLDYIKKSSKNVKITTKTDKTVKNSKEEAINEDEVVQKHYLNENFADLYDSMHDFDNITRGGQILDTITEVNEKRTLSENKSGLPDGKSNLESKFCLFDQSDDESSLKRLQEFREKNYFECHSAKQRTESKTSIISLKNHKCTYRLYLNDRLFPVAIDDDHNDKIRCVDCHLPIDLAREEDRINGTIQAKVKLGSETQDMVLLLPIKDPLIIKQKRKEKTDDDVVYFGLVRLDQNGNSMFNPSLPGDSLALRYQKGYRQFDDAQSYKYDKIEESEVVFV